MVERDETELLDSRAPYIIICNGRIGVASAYQRDEIDLAIIHASETAATLIMFYQLDKRKLPDETVKAISDHQHWLMDHLTGEEAEIKTHIAAMFDLYDMLEQTAK